MRRAKSHRRQDPPSAVKPAESPIKTFLQYSALPLTLGTALLYLLGWIYGTSYLAAWDLPISLFPLTKDQSLITGFFHLLLLFANNISLIYWLILLFLVVMIATMISCYKPVYIWLTHHTPLKTNWRKGRVVITATHDSIMEKSEFLVGWIVWIVLFVLFAALLCGWVDKQAKGRAAKERTAITTGQTSTTKLPARARLYVKDDNKVFSSYSGHLIENSTTHAALFTRDKGMVILPMSQVSRIEFAAPTSVIK